MADGFMDQIDHVIVLMMENRSLDNLAGWLYDQDSSPQPVLVGTADPVPEHYDGLAYGDFTNPDPATGGNVPVHRGVSDFCVPAPDPHEAFEHMNLQIFQTKRPKEGQEPTMRGFLADYATVKHATGTDIMQTYAPEQLGVMTGLARGYAISDAWHASNPTQTAPNRAFMHAGTSEGRVNNLPLPIYGARTIYQALSDGGHTWRVYHPKSQRFPMTRVQMLQLWNPDFDDNFGLIEGDAPGSFSYDAANGQLADYTFLEPAFIEWTSLAEATSEHPPSNVCAGEHYLSRVWDIVRKSRNWERTLFIITFDEHGGTYDHVHPTWNATPPDHLVYKSLFHCLEFRFNRFGVRIPTLLISPRIQERRVLRPPGDVPFDHTSILRTLQRWKNLEVEKMAHGRIVNAPTIETVFGGDLRSGRPEGLSPTCTNCQTERTEGKDFLTILEKWVHCGYHLYDHHLTSTEGESRRLLAEVEASGKAGRLHPRLRRLLRRLTNEEAVRGFLSELSG